MQEFNKFRVITVGFILMFIFVISAMYTNTKDITAQKTKENRIETVKKDNYMLKRDSKVNESVDDNDSKYQLLENRIIMLENELRNSRNNSSSNDLNCQIRGILNDGDVVPMSAQEALEEADMNEREIVITCNLN